MKCPLELRLWSPKEEYLHFATLATVHTTSCLPDEEQGEAVQFLLEDPSLPDFPPAEGVVRVLPEGGMCFLTGIVEKKGEFLTVQVQNFLTFQRRKHQRFSLQFPCALCILSPKGEVEEEYRGETLNVSSEGALVQLSYPAPGLSQDSLYLVKMWIAPDQQVNFYGRAVRIFSEESGVRVHLHFTLFSEKEHKKLLETLQQWKTKREEG
ncbi:MAG: PilZ domain-containing protein [bacterium JZ-2024 1]